MRVVCVCMSALTTPSTSGTRLHYLIWAMTRLRQWCACGAPDLDGTLELFEAASSLQE